MRKAMVTRTITTYTVQAMGLNTHTQEVVNTTFELSEIKDGTGLIKQVNDLNIDTHIVFVHATVVQENTALYGMTEQEFIKRATLIKQGGR